MTIWNLLRRTQRIFTMLALFLVMVVPRNANAQLGTASMNGAMQDTSGAVIPGAEVVLQNVDTGVKTVATSNGAGDDCRPTNLGCFPRNGGYDA